MAIDLIPENLVSGYFVKVLSDGSLLFKFRGSRFHSHVYLKGGSICAHLTENAEGGKKSRSEGISVKLPEGTTLRSLLSEVKMDLPGDTVGIFFDRDSMIDMVRRVAQGNCPQTVRDLILSTARAVAGPTPLSAVASDDIMVAAFKVLRLLADWEATEPGVLPRYTLDAARKRYPVKSPCFVEVDGKWLFAQLDDEGATVHPNGLSPELLKLVSELSRLEQLLSAPIKVKGKEVRQEEEFMRQLTAEYEKRISSERKELEESS